MICRWTIGRWPNCALTLWFTAGVNPAANPALALAMKLVDRTPVIYTCDGMVDPALAFRFRAQLAENSKVWARASELPELMHNEVESFAHMSQVLPPVFVLFIGKWAKRNAIADPRMALEQLLASLGVQSMRIDPSVLFPTTFAAGWRRACG